MTEKINFRPLKGAWVALHPQPIGVVQFIGGAFFGSFPTLFYRFLLRQLYDQGYTIVALPFRFTFNHWSVSIGLVKELVNLRGEKHTEAEHLKKNLAALQGEMYSEAKYLKRKLADLQGEMYFEAERLGYESTIYDEDPCKANRNYFWLGHSLGSKYIALLELLSDLERATSQVVLAECIPSNDVHKIEQQLATVDLHSISLFNQPSILMAPVIEGIESAIPFPAVARVDVRPDVKDTHCLIGQSNLFSLIGLIAFDKDSTAQPTVDYICSLPDRPAAYHQLEGKHLAPLGFRSGNQAIVDTVLELLRSL